MIVSINIEERADGICVSSDDLPGLMLSGRDRTKIIAAIEPAVRALLKHKGIEPKSLRIDASVSGAVAHLSE
jgi:hypothetical protein